MRVCVSNPGCGHPDNVHVEDADGRMRCSTCGSICGRWKSLTFYERVMKEQRLNLGLRQPLCETAERPAYRGERSLEEFG